MVVTAPSTRPGMGSVPFPGGVTFRVWAPNASAAAVSLGQPGGGSSPVPLAAEAGGIWSADVEGVGAGEQYQYVLTASPALPPANSKSRPLCRLLSRNPTPRA